MALKVVVEVSQEWASNLDEFSEFHSKVTALVEAVSPTVSYDEVAVDVTNEGITVSWEV